MSARRNPVEMARTIYPRLPDIPDEETLSAITTLETQEREFIDTAPNRTRCQISHFDDRIEGGSLIDFASTGLAQPGDRLAMFLKSNAGLGIVR